MLRSAIFQRCWEGRKRRGRWALSVWFCRQWGDHFLQWRMFCFVALLLVFCFGSKFMNMLTNVLLFRSENPADRLWIQRRPGVHPLRICEGRLLRWGTQSSRYQHGLRIRCQTGKAEFIDLFFPLPGFSVCSDWLHVFSIVTDCPEEVHQWGGGCVECPQISSCGGTLWSGQRGAVCFPFHGPQIW